LGKDQLLSGLLLLSLDNPDNVETNSQIYYSDLRASIQDIFHSSTIFCVFSAAAAAAVALLAKYHLSASCSGTRTQASLPGSTIQFSELLRNVRAHTAPTFIPYGAE
jgi:hypothetical protein